MSAESVIRELHGLGLAPGTQILIISLSLPTAGAAVARPPSQRGQRASMSPEAAAKEDAASAEPAAEGWDPVAEDTGAAPRAGDDQPAGAVFTWAAFGDVAADKVSWEVFRRPGDTSDDPMPAAVLAAWDAVGVECERGPMVTHLYRSLGLGDPPKKEKGGALNQDGNIAILGKERLAAKVSNALGKLKKSGRMMERLVEGPGNRKAYLYARPVG